MGKEYECYFTEDIWMADKHMKICSITSAIREIQIITMLRYHYTPTEQLKYKSDNTQLWQECADNGSFVHGW